MKCQRTLLLATDRSQVWYCAWGVKLLYFQKPSFDLPLKHFRKSTQSSLPNRSFNLHTALNKNPLQKLTQKSRGQVPKESLRTLKNGKTASLAISSASESISLRVSWRCPNVTLKKPCRKHSVFGLDKDSNCESDGFVYL